MFYGRTTGRRGRSDAAPLLAAVALTLFAVGAAPAAPGDLDGDGVGDLVLAGSANGQCEPGILSSVDTPDEAAGVALSGTLAYVADRGAGLQVIDVSDPANPMIIGSVNTPGDAQRVVVSGTLAFVADGAPGLRVIDVSDPTNPMTIGSVNTPDRASNLAVSGTLAYVGDLDGLQVIDVSDPTNPVLIGSADTPNNARGVAVSGTVAYVADGTSGLQVIDVSVPTDPMIIGSVPTPIFAWDVAVSGTVVYVADYFGLVVIDVSDPTNPMIIGSASTSDLARGVAVSGTVAYVGDGTSGLKVIDVSNPENPVIIGSVNTPDRAIGVAVSGAVAYVGDLLSGLYVIDVSSCELCPADLDDSRAVDFGDILAILSAWGNPGAPEDLDGSGTVDFGDLLIVLGSWGPCFPGACCFPDASCDEATVESDCAAAGGLYRGDGSTCLVDCRTGACCFEDGTCVEVIPDVCGDMGGTYRGDGTNCAATCLGACCFPDASCDESTAEADCLAAEGFFRGIGSTCAADCRTGACCFEDGTCIETIEEHCLDVEGDFRGNGSTCAQTCLGACCFEEACLDAQVESDCIAAGGTYAGDGVACLTPWVERAVAALGEGAPLRCVVAPGEEGKTLAAAQGLWREWLAAGAGRDALVVALGGGVVTDLAGFAASVFQRGVDWIAVPTTVLGMADAAIGGKTAVNLPEGKNLVGTFHQPRAVLADVDTLSTLTDEIYTDGWAEVIKAGAIADRGLFEGLTNDASALRQREPATVTSLLARAMRVKARVVESDPHEMGPREILNFGHTIGHALEHASGHALSHGRSVAIGMVAEARLAPGGDELAERIAQTCLALGLDPRPPSQLSATALESALTVDKKRRGGQLRVALPLAIGQHDPERPCVTVETRTLLASLHREA